MDNQTRPTSYSALPVALPPVDENVKTITLSFVFNVLLFGSSITDRRTPASTSFKIDEIHSVNNIVTDMIMLLVLLATRFLLKNGIHSNKVAALEDVACLSIATSRVGLGLHMACENLASIRFQPSRDSPQPTRMWIDPINFCVNLWIYIRILRAAKVSKSALLTLNVIRYGVDTFISLIAVASTLRKDIAWSSPVIELAKPLLLLYSGIFCVVSACASVHNNMSKLDVGN